MKTSALHKAKTMFLHGYRTVVVNA